MCFSQFSVHLCEFDQNLDRLADSYHKYGPHTQYAHTITDFCQVFSLQTQTNIHLALSLLRSELLLCDIDEKNYHRKTENSKQKNVHLSSIKMKILRRCKKKKNNNTWIPHKMCVFLSKKSHCFTLRKYHGLSNTVTNFNLFIFCQIKTTIAFTHRKSRNSALFLLKNESYGTVALNSAE